MFTFMIASPMLVAIVGEKSAKRSSRITNPAPLRRSPLALFAAPLASFGYGPGFVFGGSNHELCANSRGMRTYTNSSRNSFRIRTYELLDLKSFRMRTYAKGGGRARTGSARLARRMVRRAKLFRMTTF